jgi:hypothetical protein
MRSASSYAGAFTVSISQPTILPARPSGRMGNGVPRIATSPI